METSPVIHLVTDAKGTVIHEVHVQMQELPLGMKALTPEVGAVGVWPLTAQRQDLFWALALVGMGLTWACTLCGCRGDERPMAALDGAGKSRWEWTVGLPGAFLSEDTGCAQWSLGPLDFSLWWVRVGAICGAAWPTSLPPPPPQPPAPKELPCSSEDSRENLLHQAMQNSGIVLERVTGEEGPLEPVPPAASSAQPLGDGPPELPLLEVEQVETVGTCAASVLTPGGRTVEEATHYPGLAASLLAVLPAVTFCSDFVP